MFLSASNRGRPDDKSTVPFCSKGCPETWLGDRVCDQRCNVAECAWDAGDCGIDLVTKSFPSRNLTSNIVRYIVTEPIRQPSLDLPSQAIEGNETVHLMSEDNEPVSLIGPYPVVLEVEIGDYAFSLNTSFIRCLSGNVSAGCQDKDGFKYDHAEFHGPDMLQSSILLQRHDLLVGLLYHGQENAPSTPMLPIDIVFHIGGLNTLTNISVNASFIVRVIDKVPEYKGWNMTIPVDMDEIQGYINPCTSSPANMNRSETSFHMGLSPIPYRDNSVLSHEEGIFVRLMPDNRDWMREILDLDAKNLDRLYVTILSEIPSIERRKHNRPRLSRFKAKLCDQLVKISPPNMKSNDSSLGNIPEDLGTCEDRINLPFLVMKIPSPLFWNEVHNISWIHSYGMISFEADDMDHDDLKSNWSATSHGVRYIQQSIANHGPILTCMNIVHRWGRIQSDINTNMTSINDPVAQRRLQSYQTNKPRDLSILISAMTAISHRVSGLYRYLYDLWFPSSESPRQRRRLMDTYAASLIHVNRIYNKKFGHETRKVPAHMPHMINKDLIQEMQDIFSIEWNNTASHRFRSMHDMQYSFSYYYYLIHQNKLKYSTSYPDNIHRFIAKEIDTNHDQYIDTNELRSMLSMIYKKSPSDEETSFVISNCSYNPDILANASHDFNISYDISSSNTLSRSMSYKFGNIRKSYSLDRLYFTVEEISSCPLVIAGLINNFDWSIYSPVHSLGSEKDIAFEMISDNYTETMKQLDSIRRRKVSARQPTLWEYLLVVVSMIYQLYVVRTPFLIYLHNGWLHKLLV